MTTTEGIEAVFLETHNWGRAAKFFQAPVAGPAAEAS